MVVIDGRAGPCDPGNPCAVVGQGQGGVPDEPGARPGIASFGVRSEARPEWLRRMGLGRHRPLCANTLVASCCAIGGPSHATLGIPAPSWARGREACLTSRRRAGDRVVWCQVGGAAGVVATDGTWGVIGRDARTRRLRVAGRSAGRPDSASRGSAPTRISQIRRCIGASN
jgi:hypothetical protein